MSNPALPLFDDNGAVEAADTGRSRRGWSYYGTFLKCPRKWAYENPEAWGWQGNLNFGEVGGARGLGTVVHALLARHYLLKMGIAQDSMEVVLEQNRHKLTDRVYMGKVETSVQEQIDLARQRYRQYVANYATEKLTPLSVEQEYEVGFKLVNGTPTMVEAGTPGSVLFTKRSDLYARDSAGAAWDFDHKTAAEIKRSTSRAYGLHGQFHGAWWIGRAWFQGFAGPKINYVQTWAGPKFVRERPPSAPAMVEGFPRLIIGVASMIKMWSKVCTKPSDWPTTANETVCGGKYGMCEHEARCRLGV